MKYLSTRNNALSLNFDEVLLSGMAPDGGLYLPTKFPDLEPASLKKIALLSYPHIAGMILKQFAGTSISEETISKIVHDTYHQDVFAHPDVAPLIQIDDHLHILELFHGPTFAFKDYALQLLGRLFDYILEQKGQKITIVGATSGDTGSAAIEACRHCENINIFILHPRGRTSEIQRRQMTTVNVPNVKNIALEGTFDDCQAIVKSLFADVNFRDEANLSAVNSINWARICAQITYYFTAALKLGAPDIPVSFSVPTGNFGNVFAAHCARKMGLPIEHLIIGTNKNDIITRFFQSGHMRKAKVSQTLSPSMDIQISSNFERYLYELVGEDGHALSALMNQFAGTGEMHVSEAQIEQAQNDFKAYRCDDEHTIATIKAVYQKSGYVLDPHSAIAVYAAQQKMIEGARAPVVALACAHPAKFPEAVKAAIGKEPDMPEELTRIMDLPEFVTPLPNDLNAVKAFIERNI